jgi:hypothetical protein
LPDEVVESTFEEYPAIETDAIAEPSFEEAEAPWSGEIEEPSSEEYPAFETDKTAEPLLEEVETSLFDEIAEPHFDDEYPFPAGEQTEFSVDDPLAALSVKAPELSDEAAPEQILSELHDFPVEDLRKPSVADDNAKPAGLSPETPDEMAGGLNEPLIEEIDDLAVAETGAPEEESFKRPFLAVTAPLSHEVVESPPEAREGLATQLDEGLLEEEAAGPALESVTDPNSSEAGQGPAGLESQQVEEFGNDDVFAALVEEVSGPVAEDLEGDIPEWLREAEDSSVAAVAVGDETEFAHQQPAELNDIPAWLLDDEDEGWLEAEPEAHVPAAMFDEEPMDPGATPNVAAEALMAAPAMAAAYDDDDIDAAMATIIGDEVEVDPDMEDLTEIQAEVPDDAEAEGGKSAGKVSTRALEIFLVVLVAVAVFVLAALAFVVLNPFS